MGDPFQHAACGSWFETIEELDTHAKMCSHVGLPRLEVTVRQESQSIEGREWAEVFPGSAVELQDFMTKHSVDEVILRQGTTFTHYRWLQDPEINLTVRRSALEALLVVAERGASMAITSTQREPFAALIPLLRKGLDLESKS